MDEISKNDVIELSVTGQGMDGEAWRARTARPCLYAARCRASVCARK